MAKVLIGAGALVKRVIVRGAYASKSKGKINAHANRIGNGRLSTAMENYLGASANWLFVAFLSTACIGSTAVGQSQPSPMPTFPANAQEKWREYLKLIDVNRALTTQTFSQVGKTVPISTSHMEVKRNAAAALQIYRQTAAANTKEEVTAATSRYSFVLKRNMPTQSWVLTSFGAPSTQSYYIGDPWNSIDHLCLSPLMLTTPRELLCDLVQHPDFVIRDVTTVNDNGESLMKLTFEATPKDLPGTEIEGHKVYPGRMSLRRGEIVLDPEQYWLIRSYSVRSEFSRELAATVTGRLSYKTSKKGLPVLAKVSFEYRDYEPKTLPDGGIVREYTISDDVPDERDFMLSTFGIPEPPDVVSPTRSRWYLWLIGAAIVSLSAALWYRRRARLQRA